VTDAAVVIGVGTRFRHDDGIGPIALDRLADLGLGADLVELDGEPSRVIDAWDGRALAVVIDAVTTGAAPGTIHRFGPAALAGVLSGTTSSHAAGPGDAIALATALDRMPLHLVVIGVEGADFSQGEGLSPDVAASLDEVVAAVRAELGP